jgi:hypothetical protein
VINHSGFPLEQHRGNFAPNSTKEKAMSYLRNEVTKRRKSIKEKRQNKEQLKNIISLRINDEEKETLEKLTKSTSKSISDIMREAINLWSSQRSKLCLD